MLNEWQHPKSGEKRLYVARSIIKQVAERHGITTATVKAWFSQPKDPAALSPLHVSVKSDNAVPKELIEQLKADIGAECGLIDPTWAHLASQVQAPASEVRESDDSASEVVEAPAQNRNQFKHRSGSASRLSVSAIKMKGPVTIEVDHRETTLMADLLSGHPQITVKRVQLELADYRIADREGNELLIERKRCTAGPQKTDFEASLQDGGRLFDQSERLKFAASNSDHQIIPVVVLEGDVYTNAGTMLIQQIDGALSFLAAVQRISVWTTYNATHSAYVIAKLASHFIDGLYDAVSLHQAKPKNLFNQKKYILEALPGVSTVIAEALLHEFGTVAGVMQATEKELSKVKGIGPKTSRDIHRVFH